MSEQHSSHDRSKLVRKKVRRKRNLKTRFKNKLNFSLGEEKIIYIIIGIILAIIVAKALIWYIQKTEDEASLNRCLACRLTSLAIHRL